MALQAGAAIRTAVKLVVCCSAKLFEFLYAQIAFTRATDNIGTCHQAFVAGHWGVLLFPEDQKNNTTFLSCCQ